MEVVLQLIMNRVATPALRVPARMYGMLPPTGICLSVRGRSGAGGPIRRHERVPRGAHCHFLSGGGCGIHPAKPTQCRIFPFWPELVDHPKVWAKTAIYCPGIGEGPLIQIKTARAQAEEMRQEHPKLYGIQASRL